ncbi:molybdopterin-containing oxidoreductase family protein [Intestinibacter bartlettii]|jgi:anaerobic selenocysteine-containing dehydrogenase|uniref:molybdopterin-containing oxidoreductase family protein n=1 Tax=Intestinibacter bartlettii TaxID=261299 RepID=UPI0006C0AA21|nr:molybdopterin-dependent oxidoreductase [Intestinibacter bartlettii]CUP16910.1 anaerobic dehydrogenase [Intestinibacter bartlettii]
MKINKSICPYDCPTSCGLVIETDGKKILKVKGDENHPATQGLICRKMRNYEESVHSKDRILTPLKRIGKKGEGKFEKITWEEAAQEITDKWKKIIKEDGPSAILPVYYSGVMSVIHRNCGDALFNKMGACSLVKTLCSSAKGAGYNSVMGSTGALDPRELENSDYYIVWGSNMKATRIQALPTLIKARKEGKKVVLIETYSKPMEKYCDEVILIKPGTDGALALAMMNVMVEENLQDEEFLLEKSIGYHEFKKTLKQYTPKWAEEITGIPKDVIVKLAREYASVKAPAIILGSGNSRYTNGGMTVRLITILSIFTGAIKYPGGGLCGVSPTSLSYIRKDIITRPDFRTNKARVININQVSSALVDENQPIKSLFVYASNPIGSISNQNKMIKGLMRDDLFTVVHERFMTDTAKYADIVLPATFSVEQDDVYTSYGYCTLATANKVIEPPKECKSNWDMFRLLAKYMGYDDEYFKKTEREIFDELIEKSLEDVENLTQEQKYILKNGGAISTPFENHMDIKTKSGKIQIINDEMEERIPRYTENIGQNYPLNLVAVPSCETLNSIFLEKNKVVEKRGKIKVKINSKDASKRDIKNGDEVICFNNLGEVGFIAEVTDTVAQNTVIAEGVYNRDFAINGKLVNALHDDRLSDIGEATTLNSNTVEIKRV